MIIKKFKEQIKEDLEDFKISIDKKDYEAISGKAHYLKNSCLNVCLDDICQVLAIFESPEKLKNDEIMEKFNIIKKQIDYLIKD